MNDAERTAELIRRNHALLRQAEATRDEVRHAVEATVHTLALLGEARQRRRQREVLRRSHAAGASPSE